MTHLHFDDIPVFCGHEHWGSVAAYSMDREGFRADTECGAAPRRDVTFWDVVLDPYFGGWIASTGADFHGWAREKGFQDFFDWAGQDAASAWNALRPVLREQQLTGAYQVLRRGIWRLYQHDLDALEVDRIESLNRLIAERYREPIEWLRQAMESEKLYPVIRPVHPEFYVRAGPYAEQEQNFIHTVLRIDPLLELWEGDSPRRHALSEAMGISPRDARTWREFIAALFDLASRGHAVGIKQLQAYHRDLDFIARDDDEVPWQKERLTADEVRIFQDWVVHECCRQAQDRQWPFQFHVGTHNLQNSSPLPLGRLAQQYPKLKIVLLHCWPFIDESGALAKYHPNVYLDACWQVDLNPMFLERSLRAWLGFVPLSRLMFSQDATSVEMAAGSAALVRWILARALENYATMYEVDLVDLEETGRALLYRNGFGVYDIPEIKRI